MKRYNRIISCVIAFAIIISCVAFPPVARANFFDNIVDSVSDWIGERKGFLEIYNANQG